MYKVEISHKEMMTFQVNAKEYEMTIDGEGKAISPLETLLASIGSCAGVYVRFFAKKKQLPLEKFNIMVQAELTKKAPFYFKRIDLSLDLKESMLTREEKESLFEYIKNCPVHHTLKMDPDINVVIL